jgi:FkbM family methyltransferase
VNEILEKISRMGKSCEDADFLGAAFGAWREAVTAGAFPVVLYGAGSAGKDLLPTLRLHGVEPRYFCDSNPNLVNSTYYGLPVISREKLLKDTQSVILITSMNYAHQIRQDLIKDGFAEERLRVVDPDALFFYTQFFQLHATLGDLTASGDTIESVYHALSDQRSKDVFLGKIALFAKGADYASYTRFLNGYFELRSGECTDYPTNTEHFENNYYCNNPFYSMLPNETVINGGAFIGGFTLAFINYCNEKGIPYSHIHSFEPDQKNFQQLGKNTHGMKDVTNHYLGLWSQETEIRFLSSEKIEGSSARIVRESGDIEVISPRTGDIVVKTVSIDDFFSDQHISFIKLDVEGAEIEVIQGAKRTIQKHRPKLAISVYHKSNDIFEIPHLVHTICPEYRMYLRHLNDSFMGTVLFAAPE